MPRREQCPGKSLSARRMLVTSRGDVRFMYNVQSALLYKHTIATRYLKRKGTRFMNKLTSLGCIAALTAIAVFGLPRATGAATIEGSLIAMSGTTLPAVLTVQVGPTSYTVNVTSSTILVRKFGGPSSLDEFALGDLLRVEGTVTSTTVDATKIKNLSIQRKGASFKGKVLSIDASAKSFVLDPTKESLENQTVTTSTNTRFFQGNRMGIFSDIGVGMTVKVIGIWRKSLNILAADRVLIKMTELTGTVTAIDCTSSPKTITVSTKSKGHGTTSWTVNITDKTVIRDKILTVIACTDVKVNHKVHIRGLRTGDASIDALQVWDKGAKKVQNTWNGTIKSIDGTAKTFVLTVSKGKKAGSDVTVAVTAETILVNDNGKLIVFGDFVVNHKLLVKGSLTDSSVNANLIIDSSLPAS